MVKKWARRIGIAAAILVLLWCGAGLGLTLLPDPTFQTPPGAPDQAAADPQDADSVPMASFVARDGVTLRARHFPGDSSTVVLLLHGVLTDSRLYQYLASALRDRSGAEVLALDLRGHGRSEGRPGDVSRIGQYGEDVADVVAELRRSRPGARIVLAGHSMGGGIALRYAERRVTPAVDGYLLFAPLFGPDSPTYRHGPPDGEGSDTVESGLAVHVPRLIGLLMLNAVGIRALNGMETLMFNVPESAPVRAYSFRAMASMSPESHVAALTADSLPLLTLVGGADEAFHVERFPQVIARHPNGSTAIVEGADHTGILFSAEAVARASEWLVGLGR